jgi:hypothetical protein
MHATLDKVEELTTVRRSLGLLNAVFSLGAVSQ